MRKGMGHTAFSATLAASVTEPKRITVIVQLEA